jgi:CHAT domain-containing protein/tetratricopeptide (TPR) repeat protein
VLAVSDESGISQEEAVQGFDPVIQKVRNALGRLLREIPGPLYFVSFEALAFLVTRDVEKDLATLRDSTGNSDSFPSSYNDLLRRIDDSQHLRQEGLAVNGLRSVETPEDFRALVDSFPIEVWTGARNRIASRHDASTDDEERAWLSMQEALAGAAIQGDIEGGWQEYLAGIASFGDTFVQGRLRVLLESHNQAVDEHNYSEIIRIGQEIVTIARSAGLLDLEGSISFSVGNALLLTEALGDERRVEDAITLINRSLQILNETGSHPEWKPRVLVNLGSAYASRTQHDPAANQERAIALLEEALSLVSIDNDPGTWAMAHTNLALCILERNLGTDVDSDEAISHLSEALKWRSKDKDPLDWAFTQLNLGLSYSRRIAGERAGNLDRAIVCYEKAASGFGLGGNLQGQARARHNMSSDELLLFQMGGRREPLRSGHLVSAANHAKQALDYQERFGSSYERGRAWQQLGRVLEAEGRVNEAIKAFQAALEGLTPLIAPRECRAAARHLAALFAEQGNWHSSAETWLIASEASLEAVRSRSTGEGRLAEARENLNIGRWAAYALVRASQPEKALEVIEAGRALELSAWLDDDESREVTTLRKLDPVLADHYVGLRRRLEDISRNQRLREGSAVLIDAAPVAEELRSVVDEIRTLPSMERFLQRPSWIEIAAAADVGRPLAYIVTAPAGSAVLLVWRDSIPEIEVIDSVLTSSEVAVALFGTGAGGSGTGYVLAQIGESGELDLEIEKMSALIAPNLLKPLAKSLKMRGAHHVSIVAAGIIALLPLHCMSWRNGLAEECCLLDEVTVSFVPSARVAVTTNERAKNRRAKSLVVVGNPLPHSHPLPGAKSEAEIVADIFGERRTTKLLEEEATKDAVVQAIAQASHIHFACHGWSDMRAEVLSAQLSLANEIPLTAAEIVDLSALKARLVVLSACQTGIFQEYEAADEVFGLTTAFLAAGAAGVVATLWPVDDYATSLLMARFYEELTSPLDVASALRNAQLWLRDLSVSEEMNYLASHPLLRAHRMQRSERTTLRIRVEKPFQGRSLWAAFALNGS